MITLRDKETVLILIFIIVVIASGADLIADISHGATLGHVIKESVIVTLSLLAIIWLKADLKQQALAIQQLQHELDNIDLSSTPPKKYILDARKTLHNVIIQQFKEWKLTDSECDVGQLLLKGLSLKEIAGLRQTLEKTVRQQASSIYKKSGLSGRHSFSAWFIEDIL